ncbi:MAG TPA: hypothetical protein VIB08_11065, partial [Thermoanaerobaculia bacterium]
GFHALAIASALPTDAETAAALAGNPNASATLGAVSADRILALTTLGFSSVGSGSETSITFHASIDLSIDVFSFTTRERLLLAILDPVVGGSSFDSLHFVVTREGEVALDVTSADSAEASAFFDDRVIDLGDLTPGSLESLDVAIRCDFETSKADPVFGFDFVLANATIVPEPRPSLLLLLGLIVLATARRRELAAARAVRERPAAGSAGVSAQRPVRASAPAGTPWADPAPAQ